MDLQEMATEDNKPKDVDREYVLSYSIVNEQSSFMLRQNLQRAMPNIPQLQYNTLAGTIVAFQDQENFHVINGKLIPCPMPLADSLSDSQSAYGLTILQVYMWGV